MDEVSPAVAATPESVGETLRLARERQGLSLAEIANRTRVPLRHLEAIEVGNYAGLPSNTYASGFVKAYARSVGVDEVDINRQLRGELAHVGPRAPEYQPYEAPDPARVPSRGLAIVTAGLAVALIVLVGLWYGSGLFRRSPAAPATTAAAPAAPVVRPGPATQPSPAAPTGGQVTLTTTDRVWLKVHDGDKTLYQGTMAPGERFDVPPAAQNPLVDIGRPDKLRITLNGSALPPLAASSRPVTGLRIGAAAVGARLAGGTAPLASSTPAAGATPTASASRVSPRPAASGAPATSRPSPTVGNETQRANLDAAANPPAPGNAQ